jgi:hypothetical protein
MRKRQKTEEEKLAEKLATMISDLRVDLDEVGVSIARMKPTTIYNRLITITDSAEQEMEYQNGKPRSNDF